MQKVILKQGSDCLGDEVLRSGERLRVKWPDGTVQGMHIGIRSGCAFVTVNYRGVSLPVFLREDNLEVERD